MKNTLNNELAVCGFAAVKTLEKTNWERIKRLYFTSDRAPLFGGLCKKLASVKHPYNQVKDPIELEKLCGSVHHQGVVAMIEQPEILPLNSDITQQWVDEKQSAVLLDRVGNANNLGAIIRSAAFFGIQNVVIPLDEAQSSITTSSYRVAEGGMEFVHVYSIKSISRLLEDMSGRMVRIGTSLDAKESTADLKKICGDKPALVVLGNEENGISKEVKMHCDHLVIIPYGGMETKFTASDGTQVTGPKVDSLNVAQAAAVIMYEMRK
jgi:TrmH RNA methyltransferase